MIRKKKTDVPAHRAFRQSVIACIWDFDKTLISGYMQEPLFRRYGIDGDLFWKEVNHLEAWYKGRGVRVNPESVYLNHILTYVREGRMKGLGNRLLEELGTELSFYPGLPEFFPALQALIEKNPIFRVLGITLEHYVVSTGFSAMVRGSAIAPYITNVWGNEFIETPAPSGFLEKKDLPMEESEISEVAYVMDNTAKTRSIYEINKGTNLYPEIDVNSKVQRENRRVPFENMIYIADGPSDIPAFATLQDGGGRTYAIYPPGNDAAFAQVDRMLREQRIQMYGVADFREGTPTWTWMRYHVQQVANAIVASDEHARRSSVSEPPRHLHD